MPRHPSSASKEDKGTRAKTPYDRAIIPRAMRVTGMQKGFLRTGGYYGRFTKPSSAPTGETKFLDTSGVETFTAAGLVTGNLNVIPQGDGQSERVGRKVEVKSIHVLAKLILSPTSAAVGANTVRVILIQDKQANGAAFTVTDYLTTQSDLSHKNLENSNRFHCYFDQRVEMNAFGVNELQHTFEKFVKCKIPIEFDSSAASGAIATQRSNSLAMLLIADTGLTTTFNYTVRIRYTDN